MVFMLLGGGCGSREQWMSVDQQEALDPQLVVGDPAGTARRLGLEFTKRPAAPPRNPGNKETRAIFPGHTRRANFERRKGSCSSYSWIFRSNVLVLMPSN